MAITSIIYIGRTARANKAGKSLSFITQYDIDLIHNIEEYTHIKMSLSTLIKDDDIRHLLNPVSNAMFATELKLLENGFIEQTEVYKKRKGNEKKKMLSKANNKDDDNDSNE